MYKYCGELWIESAVLPLVSRLAPLPPAYECACELVDLAGAVKEQRNAI